MPVTLFANNPSTTVAVNGYNGGASTGGTPASLTAETWTVSSSTLFPTASVSAVPPTQFHIADAAAPTELILVTNMSGTGSNTWAVTRGVESTATVAHAAGATFYQVVTAADLTALKQATSAAVSPVNLVSSAAETVIASYQPIAGEIVPGTTFELIATGTIKITSTPTIAWRVRWGGVAGTQILLMTSGTGCAALTSASMSVACPFDLNATCTFVSTTSAVANMNFWFATNATTGQGTGVASSAAAVTGLTAPPGGGPLVLTATWSASSASNSLAVPAPLVFRMA